MFKNKNIITLVALICAVVSLIAAVVSIGMAGSMLNRLDKLTSDYNVLAMRLGIGNQTDLLKSWELTPNAWADGTGADILFTAEPKNYHEGMTAQLNICLGKEVNAVRCVWDGSAFTATAKVSAADGYSYICVIDGNEIPLASPETPTVYIPVYLETSMNYNCTLLVNGWSGDTKLLTLTDAHVQVNLPRLSADTSAQVRSAALVMRKDTQEVLRHELTLAEGEGEGSYELTLQNFDLALPEMAEDDQVDLWLEVTLTDGETLLSASSGWYRSGDKLYLVAG